MKRQNTAPSLRSRLEMMNALMRLCELTRRNETKCSRSESIVGKNQNTRLRLATTQTLFDTYDGEKKT